MKKTSTRCILVFLAFFSGLLKTAHATIIVTRATCENKINPLGVETESPRFSWQLSATENGESQTAYQLVCASSIKNIQSENFDLWNSGVVQTDRSVLVAYHGKKLDPATVYYWRVRVWNKHHKPGAWSEINHFTTGLFSAGDWRGAHWIGYEIMPDSLRVAPGVTDADAPGFGDKCTKRPVIPLFRKSFRVGKRIARATAFISGLGQYEMYLNGKKVGNGFLTPGWTDYDKRCLYNTYDVTDLLGEGDDVLGVIVGNGFYNINRERYHKLIDAYGYPKLICRLKIVYADGREEDICSDESWKTAPSPITFTSIYGGEDYDANMEQAGWDKAGFDDGQWKNALLISDAGDKLRPETDYPVSICDSFSVKRITQPAPGIFVYDFGQNASGIVELRIKGKRGQTVKLFPAELLDDHGLSNQKLITGNSPYYFSYTLKGDGEETWRPRFTYYGFRYLQVEGAVPANNDSAGSRPRILSLTFLHNRNSAPSNGSFTCSNDLFNKIYSLINWAIKSNMQSVVTDCPHREKLGWLEQDHLMGTSINYNFDIYSLYKEIIYDMMDAQTAEGLVPDIAPEYVVFDAGFRDSPEWGSACVILPWLVYRWYGDEQILRKSYPMMQRYVEYLGKKADHQILDYGLGDWYDFGPGAPGDAQLTPKALTATAIYYYDVSLLAKMAALLQKPEDGAKYNTWSLQIKNAFNNKFFNPETRVYSTGSQTAMAMPWCVGLVDDQNKQAVLGNLIDSINHSGKALTAGDIGFHFLVKALDEGGASQLLYEMNNRSDVPGYGLQLKKGATALTEAWDAQEASSNNHLMLGHLMEWFYSGLGGISQQPDSAAFKRLVIRPEPVGNISYVKTSFNTPYGPVVSNWNKTAKAFVLHLHVPVNASAAVFLPASATSTVYLNRKKLSKKQYTVSRNTALVQVASGEYLFEVK